MIESIPFNRSSLGGRELFLIEEAINSGQIAGDQMFSRRCHALLEDVLRVRKALLTTSCTHALEMSALLLKIQPGDEVIVPSFTFVSTANAFALRGAKIVFCDVRVDTLNIDESKLRDLLSEKTKAVVVVHYAGVGCEMDQIQAMCQQRGIAIVEDNAHGLFGKYKGRWLGTFGCLATQSFHETKNITCGEGGALLINDEQYVESAEIIREKGTNRTRFFRGQIDKYSWVGLGSSYVMSDILAAFLYGQLEVWKEVQRRRCQIWNTYLRELSSWATQVGTSMPFVPGHCEQAYHMFYLLMPNLDMRTRFIDHLRQQGISAVFHYLPLHLSSYAVRYGGKAGDCPVTEDVSERLVRLPFYNQMSGPDQSRIIERAIEFR